MMSPVPGTDRQLRVLAYADSAIFSGAESIFCDVVSSLALDRRFRLSTAVPAENRELAARLVDAADAKPRFDLPVQQLPLAAFDLYNPLRRRQVRAVLSRSDADVVLLNLPSAEYGATPLLVQGTGIPTVGLMHISGTMGELGFRLGRVRESLARRAVSRLDAVLLPSVTASKRYPAQWHPRATDIGVFRTPSPELESIDQATARGRLGLPGDRRLVGILGRLTIGQKGHDTFVEAAARMGQGRSDLGFVVAGDGKDRARIEDMVSRMGLVGSFHFLGQVQDVPAVLSAIDLIAIPSRFEGLPLVALEALTAGVPGVASSVDGLCDVWPAAWRIAPGDAGRLASLLLDLLDDEPARQNLIEEGRGLMRDLTTTDPGSDVAECLIRTVSRG